MAPPRRAAAAASAAVDDSRSEASSGAREHKGKGRRVGNGSSNRDAKGSGHAGVTSAPASHSQHSNDQPRVPWPDMPLEILHSYRHAHNLDTPSAFSSDYSRFILSRGIGLRSPTSIAARRSQLSRKPNGPVPVPGSGPGTGESTKRSSPNGNRIPDSSSTDTKSNTLHQVIGQGRVSKKQLAQSVRKHFNNAGLGEQEAISRFLYKVREEGRGHHFRLRFQP